MTKKTIKTTTLSAQVAISKSETGMDYVQVLPDNPCVGLVKPFRGLGYGQLLSNGFFDFIRKKREKRKPEFKGGYVSLSFGQDGFDRVTFVVPSEMRASLVTILRKDVLKVINYLIKKGFCRGLTE